MAKANPQTVAAFALTYRELYNAHIASPKDFLDDLEGNPEAFGLLVRAIAHELTDVDWLVLKTFDADHYKHSWAVVAEDVHGLSPPRAEAMLHSWPSEHGLPPLGASWTYGLLGSRWEAVDAAMMHLEARGLLLNPQDIDSVAWDAYVKLTGDDNVQAWIDRRLDYEEAGSS